MLESREEIMEKIKSYLLDSHITLKSHKEKLLKELNAKARKFVPVYMDMNFWITLRDTASGRGDRQNKALLDIVRASRAHCIYPIGPTVFTELLKQGDISKRIEFAMLVDELSEGITARSDDERAHDELAYQFLSLNGKLTMAKPEMMVWAKIGHIFGVPEGANPIMPYNLNLAFNKYLCDKLWSYSTVEWVKETKDMPFGQNMKAVADHLNSLNASSPRPSNYKDAYNQELGSVADIYVNEIINIISTSPVFHGMERPPVGDPAFDLLIKQTERIFAAGLRKDDVKKNLPTISIPAALYASIWFDGNRKIKPNDVFDFQHAATALPYAKAFFTDGPLRTLIIQNPEKLCSAYGCVVISDQNEAIDHLKEIILKAEQSAQPKP